MGHWGAVFCGFEAQPGPEARLWAFGVPFAFSEAPLPGINHPRGSLSPALTIPGGGSAGSRSATTAVLPGPRVAKIRTPPFSGGHPSTRCGHGGPHLAQVKPPPPSLGLGTIRGSRFVLGQFWRFRAGCLAWSPFSSAAARGVGERGGGRRHRRRFFPLLNIQYLGGGIICNHLYASVPPVLYIYY